MAGVPRNVGYIFCGRLPGSRAHKNGRLEEERVTL